MAGAPQGRPVRQPLLHADPPDLHPGQRRVPVEAHAHVRVAAQRRPHLGAEELRRDPPGRRRSPRPTATTSSSASTRRSATSCPATSPPATPRPWSTRARASGPLKNGVYLDFADAINRLGESTSCASATATSSTCTSASPARTRTRCRCASTPPPTTRWAGCGSTTTS